MKKDFTSDSIQRRAFYEQHYEVLAHIELLPGERGYIGSRKNRICRYCGKTPPMATFRNVAHTFPQFISGIMRDRSIFSSLATNRSVQHYLPKKEGKADS